VKCINVSNLPVKTTLYIENLFMLHKALLYSIKTNIDWDVRATLHSKNLMTLNRKQVFSLLPYRRNKHKKKKGKKKITI